MAKRRAILTLTFGTFDTTVLVLVGVLASYATGGLSDVLPSLGTAIGVAVYLYLWMLVLGGTYWVLGEIQIATAPFRTVALHGAGAGGVVGIAFVLGLLLALVPALVADGGALGPLAATLTIAVGISAIIGTVIGVTSAGMNAAVLAVASRLGTPTAARR
jgi:hypothetical protein